MPRTTSLRFTFFAGRGGGSGGWTVEEYPTGTQAEPATVTYFDWFHAAYGRLVTARLVVNKVRVIGPSTATDEQRQLIAEAGGILAFHDPVA